MAQDNEKSKNSKDRSVAYPSITIGDAIDFTTKLREALGKGPYSRDEAAKALGHAKLSGPAARKVAALVHYGLLERTGNAYNQTKLAQDIIKPLSDDQKNQAMVTAVRSPRLFEKLLQKYAGQALPTMLQNVIIREGVSESAANEVVRLFTESIKFSGLLVNGVVVQLSPIGGEEDSNDTNPVTEAPSVNKVPAAIGAQKQSVPVPADHANNFVFEFAGGIKLVVPRNQHTSDAIADGELKTARQALTKFADEFMGETSADSKQSEDDQA
jgi:hypothetical protein